MVAERSLGGTDDAPTLSLCQADSAQGHFPLRPRLCLPGGRPGDARSPTPTPMDEQLSGAWLDLVSIIYGGNSIWPLLGEHWAKGECHRVLVAETRKKKAQAFAFVGQ